MLNDKIIKEIYFKKFDNSRDISLVIFSNKNIKYNPKIISYFSKVEIYNKVNENVVDYNTHAILRIPQKYHNISNFEKLIAKAMLLFDLIDKSSNYIFLFNRYENIDLF